MYYFVNTFLFSPIHIMYSRTGGVSARIDFSRIIRYIVAVCSRRANSKFSTLYCGVSGHFSVKTDAVSTFNSQTIVLNTRNIASTYAKL